MRSLALPVYFWHRILQFLRTFPKGERGNRTILTQSIESDVNSVCRDRGSSVALDKTDREKPGESLGDGPGASHRRNRHVGC